MVAGWDRSPGRQSFGSRAGSRVGTHCLCTCGLTARGRQPQWWGLRAKLGCPEQDTQLSSDERVFMSTAHKASEMGGTAPGWRISPEGSVLSVSPQDWTQSLLCLYHLRAQAQGPQGSRDKRC